MKKMMIFGGSFWVLFGLYFIVRKSVLGVFEPYLRNKLIIYNKFRRVGVNFKTFLQVHTFLRSFLGEFDIP